MNGKTSVSGASSYQEIGAFWSEHDATEYGENMDVNFEVNIQSQYRYYPVDFKLSILIRQIAAERGISEETLLNLWVQEKIQQNESIK